VSGRPGWGAYSRRFTPRTSERTREIPKSRLRNQSDPDPVVSRSSEAAAPRGTVVRSIRGDAGGLQHEGDAGRPARGEVQLHGGSGFSEFATINEIRAGHKLILFPSRAPEQAELTGGRRPSIMRARL